jgi:hypothetical protein
MCAHQMGNRQSGARLKASRRVDTDLMRAHRGLVNTNDQTPLHWPEEEPVVVPQVKRTKLQRLGRFLGDVFLLGGMAKGFSGRGGAESTRSATNVMLFGEGEEQGRKANR